MKKLPLTLAIVAACGMQAVGAAEEKYVVDMSDNLYYSGVAPRLKIGNYLGNEYLAAYNYPTTPLQWKDNFDGNVAFHDCPRNVRALDANGDEVEPGTPNTFADDRTSCYGTPPVAIPLAGVAVNGSVYIRVEGRIDDNTAQDLTTGGLPLDARGLLNSASNNLFNGFNDSALIGLWVTEGSVDLDDDGSALKTYIDGVYTANGHLTDGSGGKAAGLSLVEGNAAGPGFTKIGTEFAVVENLSNLSYKDGDGDNIADEGTGEFGGSLSVPNGATHLLLGYNANKGGFYHHGDTRYIGTANPFYGTANERPYDELQVDALNEPDNFTDDTVFAATNTTSGGTYGDGDTRAVGVYMVTLSTDPSIANTSGSPKAVIQVTSSQTTLTQTFKGDTSLTNGLASSLTYQWDFGDGTTSTAANPTHTYGTAGTYTVSLVVSAGGRTNLATMPVPAGIATGGGSSGGGGGGLMGLGSLLSVFGLGLMRRQKRVKAD